MMVMGWIFWLTSCSASRSSSPASTTTDVVPSPTSSSCTFEMSAQGMPADQQRKTTSVVNTCVSSQGNASTIASRFHQPVMHLEMQLLTSHAHEVLSSGTKAALFLCA